MAEMLISLNYKGFQSSDPIVRANAQEAAYRIKNETSAVKSMREALINARRRGDIDEIKNIHEDVVKHSKYQTIK